ncbi:FMN-binding protein [Chloroflexales bacterium ZM16-3]|nr:FMN-binding protein [Chloroflexales bacterium ZM16-3]
MLPPAPPTAEPTAALGPYKDGEYTGPIVDAYFGNVQVKATVQNGQLADVSFLDFPNHRRTSVRINNYAMPYLTSEAIQVQSARVNIISGATLTSEAFAQSLHVALESAKS